MTIQSLYYYGNTVLLVLHAAVLILETENVYLNELLGQSIVIVRLGSCFFLVLCHIKNGFTSLCNWVYIGTFSCVLVN